MREIKEFSKFAIKKLHRYSGLNGRDANHLYDFLVEESHLKNSDDRDYAIYILNEIIDRCNAMKNILEG